MAEQANWYVAHTYSGYENKVATDLMTMVENRHLQDLICDVKVPTETRIEEVFDLIKEGNLLCAVVLFGLVALSLGCSGGCFLVCHL